MDSTEHKLKTMSYDLEELCQPWLGEDSKPAEIQMLRLSLTISADLTPAQRWRINPAKEGKMEAHGTNNKNDFTRAEVS